MTDWQDSGIILSVRPHGENGGVVSVLTPTQGRHAGYVYGAAGKKMRGVLEIGNNVSVQWHAKQADQLGTFSVELEKSVLPQVMDDALKLTALQAACALADCTLAEREKHTALYEGLKALIAAFDTDVWPAAYIYWELGLLRELGFGVDLGRCAATGATEDLIYVSPKSGCAVSAAAGEIYKERLLPLPGFLRGGALTEEDIAAGLSLTGYFLLNRVFALSNANLPEARLRLAEKLEIRREVG